MKKILCGLAIGGLVLLGGCTQAQLQTVVADGQLFCAVGQTVAAVQAVSPQGGVAPVLAKGASSTYVKAACALAGGIAVSPPPTPGAAPTVTIPQTTLSLSAS